MPNLARLNSKNFPELVSDILVSKGHWNVKITDGPGDGCRDVHSIIQGAKHLTQCKFHSNPQKLCSSRETGDLAVGLLKLGYTNGLFATSGRISPQAKRELLDSYPGFELEFWEGTDLIGFILSDPILKALWFDRERIARVSNRLRIPLIYRNLADDQPVNLSKAKRSDVLDQLRSTFPSYEILVHYPCRYSGICQAFVAKAWSG